MGELFNNSTKTRPLRVKRFYTAKDIHGNTHTWSARQWHEENGLSTDCIRARDKRKISAKLTPEMVVGSEEMASEAKAKSHPAPAKPRSAQPSMMKLFLGSKLV